MSITIKVAELKKELQHLQQGEFRLGYVYADDIVHLVDVFKVIDRLAVEEDCKTCEFKKGRDCDISICRTCCHTYSDYYTKENEKQPENTKDCDGCFGASFGDCEICDERGEDK